MPSFGLVIAIVGAALVVNPMSALGQGAVSRGEPVRPSGAVAPPVYFPQDRMEVVDPDKRLAAGDELTVEIEQDREGGFPKVVSATGEIDVQPVGRVKVAGKTTVEAQAELKQLLEKDYYYTATVRVSIDRRSRTVVKAGQITISGEVRAVGSMDLMEGEKLTVSQAILKAGGFGAFANQRKVQVTRSEAGGTRQFYVDVKEVLDKGAVGKDVAVQNGDRINVPRALIKF
jgi:protein involved in polysaccharide export with SLBB domain